MPAATFSYAVSGDSAPAPGSLTVAYHGEGGVPRLEMTGAQTYNIDLAMMPSTGLQGLLVTVDAKDAAGVPITAPLHVTWGSGFAQQGGLYLGAGGEFMLSTPTLAANGITSLTLVSTANLVAHVYAVG